jgi:hypothetical protein
MIALLIVSTRYVTSLDKLGIDGFHAQAFVNKKTKEVKSLRLSFEVCS